MTVRHPEKINKPINPIKKKPNWIRSKLTNSKEFFLTKSIVNQHKLKIKENELTKKIIDLEHINSLLSDNLDPDYIDILIREKFMFGKKGESTYIVNNDS